jgi:hypothetical protein
MRTQHSAVYVRMCCACLTLFLVMPLGGRQTSVFLSFATIRQFVEVHLI